MLAGIGWWPVDGFGAPEIKDEYRAMMKTMLNCHGVRAVAMVFGYGQITLFRDKAILGLPACGRGGNRKELCVPYQNRMQTIRQIMAGTGRRYSAVYSEIRRAR